MTFDDVFEQVKGRFDTSEKVDSKPDPHIRVGPSDVFNVVKMMRDEMGFETLANLGGVDLPKDESLAVVYHPFSYQHKLTVCVKALLPRKEGVSVPSLCPLFEAANWLERETYDMFGIHFEGHPDQRRILCPEDWKGFALLKDYETPDYYNDMPVPLYFEDETGATH